MTMEKEKNTTGLISEKEKSLALFCMDAAMKHGASQVRVSLNKSVLDSYGMLNGELDKVSHSADRSVFIYVFADGKYGTFSTNMLEENELERFAAQAVDAVRMLAEDRFRRLPDPQRTAKDAISGRELGLYDETYETISPEERLAAACRESIFRNYNGKGKLVSEECEYSDSVDDNFTADSQGFTGRHTETSFAVCSEVTVEDSKGRKYSGYWWDSSPMMKDLQFGRCSGTAIGKAMAQIGPKRHAGGSMTMVVDTTVSSRLVSPIISALNAASIQQESSFLKDSLDKKCFCDAFSLVDMARTCGKPGSRLFDTEGTATSEMDIIRNGVVRTWFTNTYMALKMGISPTVEGVSRPVLLPYSIDGEAARNAEEMMLRYGSGIYVTGFNGGNCNPTTGNFSYGIEGFVFKEGRIVHPVREMIITGDMKTLWNSLVCAGDDARSCTRWQIPSLCFEKVDFSG